MSVIVFFSALFGSSLCFLTLLKNSHCVHPFFTQVWWAFLWSLPKFFYWVVWLSLLHFFFFLKFCLFLSFGTYFSVFSFPQLFCIYFYVLDGLVSFPDLGEAALCRRCPTRLSTTLPSGHQSCAPGMSPVACMHISAVVHLAALSVLVGGLSLGLAGYRVLPCVVTVSPMEGRIGFPRSWLFDPRRCIAVTGPLLLETSFQWSCLHGWGSSGLVFICWWMELLPCTGQGDLWLISAC